jgi:hypothetical protein
MIISLDELEMRFYKISASHRCPINSGTVPDCDHKACEAVFQYWKSIETYLKNLRKCPSCEGSGARKVEVS